MNDIMQYECENEYNLKKEEKESAALGQLFVKESGALQKGHDNFSNLACDYLQNVKVQKEGSLLKVVVRMIRGTLILVKKVKNPLF